MIPLNSITRCRPYQKISFYTAKTLCDMRGFGLLPRKISIGPISPVAISCPADDQQA